jgi:beta-adrenergic-receptor kinase
MEELQDAIEDAQYVNAISTQEDGPRPVLAWEIPTEEQLNTWKEKVKRQDPTAYSLEWTLQSAIGLFLFSAFLKETCNDYRRINFCEEVIRWRKLHFGQRVDKTKIIVTTYLEANSCLSLPIKVEIDEYDLERIHAKVDDLETLMSANFDSSNDKCSIGLHGPVREDLLTGIHNVLEARAAYKRETEDLKTESPVSTVPESKEQLDESAGNGETHQEEEQTQDKDQTEKFSMRTIDDIGGDTSITRHPSQFRSVTKRCQKKPDIKALYVADNFFDKAEAIVMESLRKQYLEAFLESEQYTKLMNFLWYQDRRVVPEDFFVMRVLGRGGFGLVTGTLCYNLILSSTILQSATNHHFKACKKGTSGKLYAMKVMNKRRIKMKKSEQLALNERAALAAVESLFVVNLKYSFHSKDDVFLILDLMTGGDLGFHLHQKGRFPKKECVYYAARIMLGLQALHDRKYVYRDLKPENCLLAEDGRVKITDLGLATKITPTLHGAAGTRGYWAPEMLRRDRKGKRMPYGHTVDWFSFGCCLAEFISGQNPFRSETALNFGLERGKQTKVSGLCDRKVFGQGSFRFLTACILHRKRQLTVRRLRWSQSSLQKDLTRTQRIYAGSYWTRTRKRGSAQTAAKRSWRILGLRM